MRYTSITPLLFANYAASMALRAGPGPVSGSEPIQSRELAPRQFDDMFSGPPSFGPSGPGQPFGQPAGSLPGPERLVPGQPSQGQPFGNLPNLGQITPGEPARNEAPERQPEQPQRQPLDGQPFVTRPSARPSSPGQLVRPKPPTDQSYRKQPSQGQTPDGQLPEKQPNLVEPAQPQAPKERLDEKQPSRTRPNLGESSDRQPSKPPSLEQAPNKLPNGGQPNQGQPSRILPSTGQPANQQQPKKQTNLGKSNQILPSPVPLDDEQQPNKQPNQGKPNLGQPSPGQPSQLLPSPVPPANQQQPNKLPNVGQPVQGQPNLGEPYQILPSPGQPVDEQQTKKQPNLGKPNLGQPNLGQSEPNAPLILRPEPAASLNATATFTPTPTPTPTPELVLVLKPSITQISSQEPPPQGRPKSMTRTALLVNPAAARRPQAEPKAVVVDVLHSQSDEAGIPFQPLVSLGFGTPPQTITGILDTGSSDLIIPQAASDVCRLPNQQCRGSRVVLGDYDASKDKDARRVAASGFAARFQFGETYNGSYINTTVSVGDARIKAVRVGLASNGGVPRSSAQFPVFGVGPADAEQMIDREEYANLPQIMKDSGLIDTSLFSVWLNPRPLANGSVVFGGADSTKFTGELQPVPIERDSSGRISRYVVNMSSISLSMLDSQDSQPQSVDLGLGQSKGLTSVSSSTPSLLVPKGSMENLAQALGTTFSDADGLGPVDCALAATDDNSLLFGFNQDQTVLSVPLSRTLVPKEMSGDASKSGRCALAIASAGTDDDAVNVMGYPFMSAVYTVFDKEGERLMFAPAAE
ncbi:Peptidase aspartic [Metarhizium rileyi]|uniref:Peptidase aspartic n=1 Tax=Metarhizium rileyi (strain RCEF 4871) TaxID=1649241 RepID=A0A166ZE70_METRR|nr:Peptidase aspartic [Metarhizium rileyi RCEF 4871]